MKMPNIKSIKVFFGKNSTTLLMISSITGVVGTAFMAVRATPKAMQLIKEEEWRRERVWEDNPDVGTNLEREELDLTKFEIFKLVWTCYIPPFIMGSATIASIIGGNTINTKRNAALTSAYFLSETALKEYQAKIIEKIGEKKAKLIRDEIAQDRVSNTKRDDKTIIITGNGDTICLDVSSGRYFKSSVDKLRKAVIDINYSLRTDNEITLNEIYDYMGLDPIAVGGKLGWDINKDGIFDIDFSTCLTELDEACITCTFEAKPRYR